MIKTKENQNGCASSNNLKEKEYTLKASSIQSFCLNLHFESAATALSLFSPTPYYTFKQARFLRYFILFTIIVLKYYATQRNSVKLKVGDQNERNCCECASDNTYHFYSDLNAEGVLYLFQVVSDDGFIEKCEFLNLKPSSRAALSG